MMLLIHKQRPSERKALSIGLSAAATAPRIKKETVPRASHLKYDRVEYSSTTTNFKSHPPRVRR